MKRESRGASVPSLIKTARAQALHAKEQEANGDLKGALSSYVKSASLTKMAMDSPDFSKAATDLKSVIRKEWESFLQVGRNLCSWNCLLI